MQIIYDLPRSNGYQRIEDIASYLQFGEKRIFLTINKKILGDSGPYYTRELEFRDYSSKAMSLYYKKKVLEKDYTWLREQAQHYENTLGDTDNPFSYAIEYADMEMIKFLASITSHFSRSSLLYNVVIEGKLEAFKYLIELFNYSTQDVRNILQDEDVADGLGDVENEEKYNMVNYLFDHNYIDLQTFAYDIKDLRSEVYIPIDVKPNPFQNNSEYNIIAMHNDISVLFRPIRHYSNLRIVKTLIEKGADANELFGFPLLLAIRKNAPDIVKYLIFEAKVNIHYNNEILSYLLQAGADAKVCANLPLKMASLKSEHINFVRVARLLLEYGADWKILDEKNKEKLINCLALDADI